jgi:hypothetical protein
VILWDVATGKESLRLPGRTWWALSTAPDNGLLVLESEASGDSPQPRLTLWQAQAVVRELEAAGLASCMLAPPVSSGLTIEPLPYPFNRFVDSSDAANSFGILVKTVVLIVPVLLLLACLKLLARHRRRGEATPPALLKTFAVVGLLGALWGFYFLFTLLNTPEWTWFNLLQGIPAYVPIYFGAQTIVRTILAYRTALYGADQPENVPSSQPGFRAWLRNLTVGKRMAIMFFIMFPLIILAAVAAMLLKSIMPALAWAFPLFVIILPFGVWFLFYHIDTRRKKAQSDSASTRL